MDRATNLTPEPSARQAVLPIKNIDIPEKRERQRTPKDVARMKESIEKNGLLHSIGVKQVGDGRYRAVYGVSRLMAYRELQTEDRQRWSKIEAKVYPSNVPDEVCRRYEIVENLHRSDLTRDQRKEFERTYGQLLVAAGVSPNGTNSKGGSYLMAGSCSLNGERTPRCLSRP